jgi:hypothetical protein
MMPGMTEAIHMRLVIVAPESLTPGSDTDEVTQAEAERSRMLRLARSGLQHRGRFAR